MKRFSRLCLLTLILGVLAVSGVYSAKKPLSGVIGADSVRVLLKDDTTFIDHKLFIKGTLIIEPGTTIQFYDNGSIIVEAGGRLIADGFAKLEKHPRSTYNSYDRIITKWPERGYADIRCFLYPAFESNPASLIGDMTAGLRSTETARRERTIHPSKYNYIFNVAIDTATRRLVNITDPTDANWRVQDNASNSGAYTSHNVFQAKQNNDNLYVVPFETAIMFMAARLNEDPNGLLKTNDWIRANTKSVNVDPGQIKFVGQPQNNNSREWGHIVVLPGARAAFFRNCEFFDIKKDTTVDNEPYYKFASLDAEETATTKYDLNSVEMQELNNEMLQMSNGGGGAITTFSSRTWLLDCRFVKNFARNRGGAVQVLQAPTTMFYPNHQIIIADTVGCERFVFDRINESKNFRVSDNDAFTSIIMWRKEAAYPRYPKIDKIDEPSAEDIRFRSDINRMAWDDGRLAGYLGRFRNLVFDSNMVRLAKTIAGKHEGTGKTVIIDDTTAKVPYPLRWGNMAYGGAMYIAGRPAGADERPIEFTLGMNDSIRLGTGTAFYNPNNFNNVTGLKDYLFFTNNTAQNLQDHKWSDGAKGGAIYVGDNTSLIVAGTFTDNFTHTKWLVDTTHRGLFNDLKPTPYENGILYSVGGAIYSNPSANGRLQIRGDRDKDNFRKMEINGNVSSASTQFSNQTMFVNNRAGAGGAIYVAESPDVLMSPQIGGSDVNKTLNNYGWKIYFKNNYAHTAGGAIYSKRNMDITGAGGSTDDYQYSTAHIIRFDSNAAAFAGGAIHVEIPVDIDRTIIPNTRIVNLRRVEFRDNNVGKLAFDDIADVNNTIMKDIRGGGAVYGLWADLNVVRGAHFTGNAVYNGNGGGIEMVNPYSRTKRLFVTDLDRVLYEPIPSEYSAYEGLPLVANAYESVNNPFTYGANYKESNAKYVVKYPDEYNAQGELLLAADMVSNPIIGMLNRFEENKAIVDSTIGQEQIKNYGNTQISAGYLMPNQHMMAQWWFGADNGFIGGTEGTLVQISKDYVGDWGWSEKYNDSLWHTHSFTDIQFTSNTTGYMADNFGYIYKTTNKGANWTAYHLATSPDIVESVTDIHILQGLNIGLAVTNAGRIYYTNNSGTTWEQIWEATDNISLNGVHFASSNLAYAVGTQGTVIQITRDALGVCSTLQQWVPGLNLSALNKVVFRDASKGVAIGDGGKYLYTTNGGTTWNIDFTKFSASEDLLSIAILGQDFGYITTNKGGIYKTADGDATWTPLATTFTGPLYNVNMLDDNQTVFVVGSNDLIQRSTDAGENWSQINPANKAVHLGNPRLHGGMNDLVENGIGLGGAIYILDFQNKDVETRTDSISFNRTRILDNFAFSGSAIYSDNYDLKLIFNRSLIRGNKTDSNNTIGMEQNLINGPINRGDTPEETERAERNWASSDLVSATIYGEIQGPFPSSDFSTLANSIFENQARFLIRLPDAPNTKGILAGLNSGRGKGGTDTLTGNYWGHTEANVGLKIINLHDNHTGEVLNQDEFTTFFVEKLVKDTVLKADKNYLPFYNDKSNGKSYDPRRQGPFEYNTSDYKGANNGQWTYEAILLENADVTVPNFENIPADLTIPEKYLFSFDIYDLHDKGTDIKTADYSKRRMFPIEDFAVGNPAQIYIDDPAFIDTYDNRVDQASISKKEKYVKRWVWNPEYANAVDADNNPIYPDVAAFQHTWAPMTPAETDNSNVPKYYHPISMPMYLETKARINIGDFNVTNRDFKHQASTVFFVINETTQDYIRVDLKQIPRKYGDKDSIWADDIFRTTVFFTPDSTKRGDPQQRRAAEMLAPLGSNGTYPFGNDPEATGGSGSPEMLRRLTARYDGTQWTNVGIQEAAENEDYGALVGRKYQENSSDNRIYFNLGDPSRTNKIVKLFSNRPDMPTDNDILDIAGNNETRTTFYAGERYGTLPVNVGDVIRVISRNVLWKQGVVKAYDGGLVFIIKEGPEAPIFVGDLDVWGKPELNPYVTDYDGNYPVYNSARQDLEGNYTEDTIRNLNLLNKIFVTTNRQYPATNKGDYSDPSIPDNYRGTDFILNVTAIDKNGFYDPRINMFNNEYTALIYNWNFLSANSGLSYWLMADTIRDKDDKIPGLEHSVGYLKFFGVPLNPYIVPGGEKFQVSATNYAPGIALLDSLRAVGTTQDVIDRYYQTFPPYLMTPWYNQDVTGESDMTARYLQQDTMGLHGNIAISKELTIFVMDTLPRFIPYKTGLDLVPPTAGVFYRPADGDEEPFLIKKDGAFQSEYDTRPYLWTRFQAGQTLKDANPKYLVNVTDKLRFRMDLNTDDELEDYSAQEKGWLFPYGRTAYSFANLTNNGGDTIIIDTILGDRTGLPVMSQLKPSWIREDYANEYDNWQVADPLMVQFQRFGQMNLRIDAVDAFELLRRPEASANGIGYNTDTIMAVVANDGHGGQTTKLIDLYINFQPMFVTETLLPAEEGKEYNFKMDSTRGIMISDINPDQTHTYELIYASDPRTGIAYDPAFEGETAVLFADIPNSKQTPTWLKINPTSGVLYGVPEIITNLADTNAYVTVLIRDEDGLYNLNVYPLKVGTGNCPPQILVAPAMDCIVSGEIFDEIVTVTDRDLIRTGTENETLTLSVLEPSDILEVYPSTLTGTLANDTQQVHLRSVDGLPLNLTGVYMPDGRLTVMIEVKDKKGLADTITIRIRTSEIIDFLSTVTVTNSLNHSINLQWGTAVAATTGDALDQNAMGQIDSQYCEIEIPPIPNSDAFDARWAIPTKNGLYRNIYPTAYATQDNREYRYRATFQAGGIGGTTMPNNYPVTLSWDTSSVPSLTDNVKNPTGSVWKIIDGTTNGSYFNVNMRNVAARSTSSVVSFSVDPAGIATIQILDDRINNFHIIHDWKNDIDDTENDFVNEILGVSPSPVTEGTDQANITFEINQSGNVYIELFDVLGNKVVDIADGYFDAGKHNVSFNLRNYAGNKLSSGSYTVRMTTGMDVKVFMLIVAH